MKSQIEIEIEIEIRWLHMYTQYHTTEKQIGYKLNGGNELEPPRGRDGKSE